MPIKMIVFSERRYIMSVLEINKSNFESEVLNSDLPVLIDFWAAWCGPCKMFSPIVDSVAEEHSDKLRVGKINIDEEPDLASQFGVVSIPTVVLFKGGKEAGRKVGLVPKQALEDFVGL